MSLQEPRLPNIFDEAHLSPGHPFKRSEDWERLTRLEYIVESIAKEHERQARELSIVIQTQTDMMGHLKTVKYTVMGIFGGLILSQIGLEKTLEILSKIVGLS